MQRSLPKIAPRSKRGWLPQKQVHAQEWEQHTIAMETTLIFVRFIQIYQWWSDNNFQRGLGMGNTASCDAFAMMPFCSCLCVPTLCEHSALKIIILAADKTLIGQSGKNLLPSLGYSVILKHYQRLKLLETDKWIGTNSNKHQQNNRVFMLITERRVFSKINSVLGTQVESFTSEKHSLFTKHLATITISISRRVVWLFRRVVD